MIRESAMRVAIILCASGSLISCDKSFLSSKEGEPGALIGKPAPAFSLKTIDGESRVLADQKGKVVLIDNWATWCPPCRESLPHVQNLSTDRSLADRGLIVWAIDDKESANDVRKFLTDNKYTFSVLMDGDGLMQKDYFVSGIPTTFIIGRDGMVKDAFVGYGGDSAKEIDAAVQKALAEPAGK